MTDAINPRHYRSHPSGVECIQITEHMNFCLGNAVKYLWRAGLKSENPVEDLKKAAWYIEREIARLKGVAFCDAPDDLQDLEPTPEEDEAWDERRADLIGLNGNDGLHYPSDPCTTAFPDRNHDWIPGYEQGTEVCTQCGHFRPRVAP